MAGTKADIEERAKLAGLGAGAKVTSDAPGHVVVTPSGRRPWWLLQRAQRELQRHAAAGVRLVVAIDVARLPAMSLPADVRFVGIHEVGSEGCQVCDEARRWLGPCQGHGGRDG